MACWYFICFVLHIIVSGLCQEVVVFINPPAFTASLSTDSSDKVSFNCTVSSNITPQPEFSILMQVNGEQFVGSRDEENGITRLSANVFTIEPTTETNNSNISCMAVSFSEDGVIGGSSEPLVFLVQGLLAPPPGLSITTPELRPNFRRLSWQPPFTLDITGFDPDITGYRICFSLSATSPVNCVQTDNTSYDYLNIRLPLEFLVTAINVVGESNASRAVHQACIADRGTYV
jgi:hypothetical protein